MFKQARDGLDIVDKEQDIFRECLNSLCKRVVLYRTFFKVPINSNLIPVYVL